MTVLRRLRLASARPRRSSASSTHSDQAAAVSGIRPPDRAGPPGAGRQPSKLAASLAIDFTYREQSQTFESVALWYSNTASVTGGGNPEEVQRLQSTHELLPLLRVKLSARLHVLRSRRSARQPRNRDALLRLLATPLRRRRGRFGRDARRRWRAARNHRRVAAGVQVPSATGGDTDACPTESRAHVRSVRSARRGDRAAQGRRDAGPGLGRRGTHDPDSHR